MSTSLKERIGMNLRAIRIRSGLTLREVSKMAGVSISMLSMYETGERPPSIDRIEQIADLFGIDPVSLIAEKLWIEPEGE